MIASTVAWAGGDARWSGLSDPEAAALEVALRLAERDGDEVVVVTVGPEPAESLLRTALAAGAHRAVRVPGSLGLPSEVVARSMAPLLTEARWVVCGNASSTRGSGAVPAFLAAELAVAQALGLIALDAGDDGALDAVRRLDGGRREQLRVLGPAVLSVEGAVASLRRPTIAAELAARSADIELVAVPDTTSTAAASPARPYRPRARVLPGPHGATLERVRTLLAAGTPVTTAETVTLDPGPAAERIVQTLRTWGYLPDPS